MISAGVWKEVKLRTTSLLKLKNFYVCFSNIPPSAELVQPKEASDKTRRAPSESGGTPPGLSGCGREYMDYILLHYLFLIKKYLNLTEHCYDQFIRHSI
jgi:hypothetical protein